MKTYLMHLILATALIGASACGSTTSTGGGSTTTDTASGSDTGAGSDTTSGGGDTTSGGSDTTSGSDISMTDMGGGGGGGGDGMGGGGDGMGGGGDGQGGPGPCETCMQASCGTQMSACASDKACIDKMQTTGDCIKAAGSDQAAAQKCLDDFIAASPAAKDFVTCIQGNCAKECL